MRMLVKVLILLLAGLAYAAFTIIVGSSAYKIFRNQRVRRGASFLSRGFFSNGEPPSLLHGGAFLLVSLSLLYLASSI